jgi:hypothetical protein
MAQDSLVQRFTGSRIHWFKASRVQESLLSNAWTPQLGVAIQTSTYTATILARHLFISPFDLHSTTEQPFIARHLKGLATRALRQRTTLVCKSITLNTNVCVSKLNGNTWFFLDQAELPATLAMLAQAVATCSSRILVLALLADSTTFGCCLLRQVDYIQ